MTDFRYLLFKTVCDEVTSLENECLSVLFSSHLKKCHPTILMGEELSHFGDLWVAMGE